ncbi:MAG: hypothetical protein MPJ22_08335, partial [Pirellulales bacterium]|nr:hypothetical protein [Pirellulales bacterium]
MAGAKDRSVMTGTGGRNSGKITQKKKTHKTPRVLLTSGMVPLKNRHSRPARYVVFLSARC